MSIGTGDRVKVSWEYLPTIEGIVESIPQDVGDSWSIKGDNGTDYKIILFAIMEKLSSDWKVKNENDD